MASIIVVDDENSISHLFRRILIEAGHTVEVTDSAGGLRGFLRSFMP